ncbi:OmpA family protein [Parafrankia sp. BMG5.11]|uniref:OmpA family protein n=1 Tax=Parafrankia sp. BMG5.11 TaxID=222540 RepID=UPI00103DF4C1|nr:OmpA family protein [Parafrankia sp. BMG5.11]TCJ35200.1 OmpA family protein [Parafrankia sp. BMG5.11]
MDFPVARLTVHGDDECSIGVGGRNPKADRAEGVWGRLAFRLCATFIVLTLPGLTTSCGEEPRDLPAVAARELPNVQPPKLSPICDFTRQPDGSLVGCLAGDYFFAFDSADLRPETRGELSRLLPTVLAHEGVVRIKGYTDGIGSAEYNKFLSAARAQSVRSWLIEKGARQEIVSEGLGEEGAADNVADDTRRRVLIILEP